MSMNGFLGTLHYLAPWQAPINSFQERRHSCLVGGSIVRDRQVLQIAIHSTPTPVKSPQLHHELCLT